MPRVNQSSPITMPITPTQDLRPHQIGEQALNFLNQSAVQENLSERGLSYIDKTRLPADKALKYVRYIRNNVDDLANLQLHQRMGWEPVPIDLFPEFKPFRIGGGTAESAPYVFCGDSILMWRDRNHHNQCIKEIEMRTKLQHKTAAMDSGVRGHPQAPLKVFKNESRFFKAHSSTTL